MTRFAIRKLLSRRRIEGECWLWTGGLDGNGYGRVCIEGGWVAAHRLSAILFLGLDPDGPLLALHSRECPNRACWRPEHVYVGNERENALDAVAVGVQFGAHELRKTRCARGHPYDDANTHLSRRNKRVCRTCERLRQQSWKLLGEPAPGLPRQTSRFVGVSWCGRTQRWVATVRTAGKQLWLGRFKTEAEAAEVAAAKRRELFPRSGEVRP